MLSREILTRSAPCSIKTQLAAGEVPGADCLVLPQGADPRPGGRRAAVAGGDGAQPPGAGARAAQGAADASRLLDGNGNAGRGAQLLDPVVHGLRSAAARS